MLFPEAKFWVMPLYTFNIQQHLHLISTSIWETVSWWDVINPVQLQQRAAISYFQHTCQAFAFG